LLESLKKRCCHASEGSQNRPVKVDEGEKEEQQFLKGDTAPKKRIGKAAKIKSEKATSVCGPGRGGEGKRKAGSAIKVGAHPDLGDRGLKSEKPQAHLNENGTET